MQHDDSMTFGEIAADGPIVTDEELASVSGGIRKAPVGPYTLQTDAQGTIVGSDVY
jgi:hypothetical protein